MPEPMPHGVMPEATVRDLTLTDGSLLPKWRVFAGDRTDIPPGTSTRAGDRLIWSISPGEWTVLGPKPSEEGVVDLTHVRAMFRLTGEHSPGVIAMLCPLDLGDDMFPNGAAARTLFAGVATELIRDDQDGARSYLIVPSRSFGAYLHETILDALLAQPAGQGG